MVVSLLTANLAVSTPRKILSFLSPIKTLSYCVFVLPNAPIKIKAEKNNSEKFALEFMQLKMNATVKKTDMKSPPILSKNLPLSLPKNCLLHADKSRPPSSGVTGNKLTKAIDKFASNAICVKG